jgi:hypothetical protein
MRRAKTKTEDIKIRIPTSMKNAIIAIANARVTSESEIGREAMVEYLTKRGIKVEPDNAEANSAKSLDARLTEIVQKHRVAKSRTSPPK